MDDYSRSERRGYRRVVIAAVLVFVALGLFPMTAAVLDGAGEGLILPVFVVAMVALGAVLWIFVPAVTGEQPRAAHRVAVGGGAGLVAALVAIVVFYALLNGFSGA